MARRSPWRLLARPGSLLGLLLALALWTLAGLEPWQGRVVSVPDGDTIVVRDEHGNDVRVRLYGIDAPELHQRGGEQARATLLRMVMDRKVYLVTIDRDGYGREVAHVRTRPLPWAANEVPHGDARTATTTPARRQDTRNDAHNTTGDALPAELSADVNGDMLRAGQAWFYGEYCRLPYPCLSWYLTAGEARETNIGLWKTRNPTPPWEWRRKNR
jgi:endonuclease YncB( thermonuclease family)